MVLEEYRRKRQFDRTPEPAGEERRDSAGQRRFFVQKHNARNLHYDLRLEMDGVLKSWAIPKGPSLDPHDKRLAVQVEDHPLEYGDFEGVIPQGEYGAGGVIVWDAGTWYPLDDEGYEKGDLKLVLEGSKLTGKWMLVHTGRKRGDPKHWLWFKERDEAARAAHEFNVVKQQPRSVLSGRSIEEIEACPPALWRTAAGQREWTATGQPPADILPPTLQVEALQSLDDSRLAPMPSVVQPLLPTSTQRVPTGDDWLHEIKYDGYRMVAHKQGQTVRLISRNQIDWTTKAPRLAAELASLPIDTAILDGEVVVHDEAGVTNFQLLQNRIRRGDSGLLCYYAFDLIYANGFDLTRVPLIERKALLDALLAHQPLSAIRYSKHILGDGSTVMQQAESMGLEGIVCKKVRSRYHGGRSSLWLKKKFLESGEFTIVGYTTSAAQKFGALILAKRDEQDQLTYVGRVGTGFSSETLDELADALQVRSADCPWDVPPEKERGRDVRWVRPEMVAEVEFGGWTNDGLLRFASYRGLRWEGDPAPPTPVGPVNLDAAALDRLPRERLAQLKLTHPDRIMYPQFGVTKLDLVTYYAQAASRILPHLVNRPLSLYRCPSGVAGDGFFQKQPPQGLPESVDQVEIETEKGERRVVMRIEDAAGLLALVQFSVLEFHIGGGRLDRLDRPDQIVFDLDPDPSVEWISVLSAAVEIRQFLDRLGLVSFVKTSGGKGLHVVVPIRRRSAWDDVFEFSHNVARLLARQRPQRFVATVSKSARRGRIYIDYLRNKPAATAIAPLSTRARETPAIAMPVSWQELPEVSSAAAWTMVNVANRLGDTQPDPWEGFFDVNQTLTKRMLQAVV